MKKLIITPAITNGEGGQLIVSVRLYDKDTDFSFEMPDVTYQHIGRAGIDDYAERKRKKVIDGYSIIMGNNVLYNVFVIEGGELEVENLYGDLLTLAGNATTNASWLRGAVTQANGFAHTAKNYVHTYRHFFGDLTAEQRSWMQNNTLSFEQETELANERAKLRNLNKQGNDSAQ